MRRSSRVSVAVLGVLAVSLWVAPASGGGAPTDGAPSGTIAFFVGVSACPMGWAPASDVQGRLVVGADASANVGVTVGTPLGDAEDRTHTHDVTATVSLTPRAIAAADGPDLQGAGALAYDIAASTTPSTSGLPFVQLLVCERP